MPELRAFAFAGCRACPRVLAAENVLSPCTAWTLNEEGEFVATPECPYPRVPVPPDFATGQVTDGEYAVYISAVESFIEALFRQK